MNGRTYFGRDFCHTEEREEELTHACGIKGPME
jgi:hypothetical protein